MLARLIGRDPVEVGKSALLLFVTLIAVIALQQLASTRASETGDQADRSAVLSVARDFGQELTTYDYAHPDVQQHRLAPLVTSDVLGRVRGAMGDLELYHAVSVGQQPDAYVQTLDSGHAEVLLQTRSVMQSQFIAPGTHTSGLLVCELERQGSDWKVSEYRWLTPATEGVS